MSRNSRKIANEGLRLMSSTTICWEQLPCSVAHLNFGDWPVDSPEFVFKNSTWHLRLAHKENNICFEIIRVKSSGLDQRLEGDLILGNSFCKICYSFVADFKEAENNNSSQCFTYPLRDFFQKFTGTLLAYVTCVLSNDGSHADAFSQTELQDAKGIETLCQNLEDLLLNGQDHDVILKVKDKELRAHRNILRMRSEVLNSMLRHDMVEKNSGVIDIPDCDPDAFQQFLLYLYRGKVEKLDAGNMLALYYIADKYGVEHLQKKCRETIKCSLDSNCVSDVIQLSLGHNDSDLLQCGTDYFVENVNEILPTVEWQSFVQRNGIQANELFMKAAKKWRAGKA